MWFWNELSKVLRSKHIAYCWNHFRGGKLWPVCGLPGMWPGSLREWRLLPGIGRWLPLHLSHVPRRPALPERNQRVRLRTMSPWRQLHSLHWKLHVRLPRWIYRHVEATSLCRYRFLFTFCLQWTISVSGMFRVYIFHDISGISN